MLVALPTVWSVPLVLESVDLLLAAVIVAVMTLVLLLLQRLSMVVVDVVVVVLRLSMMLEHSKEHTNLAVDLLTLASVLEVNRQHLMADSLRAIPFVNDPIHLYGPVAVNIVASNRLNRLASDHLAMCCSLAAAVVVAVVFGFADADTVAVAAAVPQPALDQAEYFDSVFVDFDTTSEIYQN